MRNLNRVAWQPGRLLMVMATALAVASCGIFPDRAERYRDEPYGEPVKMPEGMDSSRLSSLYPIPETFTVVEQDAEPRSRRSRFELPAPPDLTADILDDNYMVEESGDQTWLLVNDVPGRVWPAVSAFLTEQGIQVSHDNPRTGLKQSGVLNYSQRARAWLPEDDDSDETLRVMQFRIAHGVRSRSTEVQVRLQAVEEAPATMLVWATESQNDEAERAVLDAMAEYFSDTDDTKAYSRVALDLPREDRVSRVTEHGELAALDLSLSRDRAWFEISRALSAAQVPVVDIDRSAGLWYVDFRDPDDLGRRWLFWRESRDPEFTFLVRLAPVDDSIRVTAERAPSYDGEDRSIELLRTLFERLQ